MREKSPGLYLHIPFCRERCHFCYFRAGVAADQAPDKANELFLPKDLR